jgi:hypothetical protein
MILTRIAILALCAAAIVKVAGWPGAVPLCVAALTFAACRSAWLFFTQEDIADVYERRRR